jgi:hypothetical protein
MLPLSLSAIENLKGPALLLVLTQIFFRLPQGNAKAFFGWLTSLEKKQIGWETLQKRPSGHVAGRAFEFWVRTSIAAGPFV